MFFLLNTRPVKTPALKRKVPLPRAPVLPEVPVVLPPDSQHRIQWMTDHQIQEVSTKLARIKQVAIRAEAAGDYFKSGEMAYQIQEIIQATAVLFTKSRRVRE